MFSKGFFLRVLKSRDCVVKSYLLKNYHESLLNTDSRDIYHLGQKFEIQTGSIVISCRGFPVLSKDSIHIADLITAWDKNAWEDLVCQESGSMVCIGQALRPGSKYFYILGWSISFKSLERVHATSFSPELISLSLLNSYPAVVHYGFILQKVDLNETAPACRLILLCTLHYSSIKLCGPNFIQSHLTHSHTMTPFDAPGKQAS